MDAFDPGSVQQQIDALWDFNDPTASEEHLRAAASAARSVAQTMELQTQIARAQGLQRKSDQAHSTLNEVERILQDHQDDPAFANARIRVALERGRLFNSAAEEDKALPLFEQAWNLANEVRNDHLAIDATHMIAIVHGSLGGNDAAMEWNLRALALAESSAQPRARQWRGSLHNNIGWTLHDQARFDEALVHFEVALSARLEQNKPEDVRIARWCVARCFRSLGQVERALTAQRAIAAELQRSGAASDGFVDEEIGECLLALGQTDAARPHFAAAHAVLSKDIWLKEREPHRLARLAQLGGIG